MNVLITGASGFVGRSLISFLSERSTKNYNLLTPKFRLESLLEENNIDVGCDVAVHLAGLVHTNSKESHEFDRINFEATILLAKKLAMQGMKRFIFISSIGVNGSSTPHLPFTELTTETPSSLYAKSKFKAEEALKLLATEMNFELVVIRPPLIYGKDAPGNFLKIMKLALTKLPLPFGRVKNKRSFISIYNLCDFIELAIAHPKAKNELFLVSDDEKYSTRSVVETIWKASSIKSYMIPAPVILLRFLFTLIGRRAVANQLLDNLIIDNSKAKRLLGWKPQFNLLNTLK